MKISDDVLETVRLVAKTGKDADLRETLEKYFGAVKPQKSFAKEVEEFVMSTDGYFSSTEVLKSLHVSTDIEQRRKDQKNISIILRRLRERGIIEKYGTRQGVYRLIEGECELIDWRNAPTKALDIKLPFELEKLVDIYSGNIIVIAGSQNSGKTTFLLNVLAMNMNDFDVHFFSSEMGSSEMKLRLKHFENIESWNFHAWERSSNFADIIKKDSLNIVDFLEITDNFYQVGAMISDIHNKLGKGIAAIAIQKNPGQELGRGASFGTEKPRLYLSLDYGTIKIIKAKNWHGVKNPNNLKHDFKILKGATFIKTSDWYSDEKPFTPKGW